LKNGKRIFLPLVIVMTALGVDSAVCADKTPYGYIEIPPVAYILRLYQYTPDQAAFFDFELNYRYENLILDFASSLTRNDKALDHPYEFVIALFLILEKDLVIEPKSSDYSDVNIGVITEKQFALHLVYLLNDLERQYPFEINELKEHQKMFMTSYHLTQADVSNYIHEMMISQFQDVMMRNKSLTKDDLKVIFGYVNGKTGKESVFDRVLELKQAAKSKKTQQAYNRLNEFVNAVGDMAIELYQHTKTLAFKDVEELDYYLLQEAEREVQISFSDKNVLPISDKDMYSLIKILD